MISNISSSVLPSLKSPVPVASNWLDRICKAIYNFAMHIFKAIRNCFGGTEPSTSVSVTTTIDNSQRMTGSNTSLNLIAFYRGTEGNNNGVTFDQILGWDDTRLEAVHNYIQWLFPLRTVSGPNPTAPILDNQTIQTFQNDPALKNQVLRSFHRMLTFYGLQIDERTQVVSRAPNFNFRASVWLLNPSGHHNFLRITRILDSMRLLGLSNYCNPFFNVLQDIARHEGQGNIGDRTLGYWKAAGQGR